MTQRGRVRLDTFSNPEFDPGRGAIVRTLWFLLNACIMQSRWIPFSGLRVWLLRRFGAKVGRGVRIKPEVNVKYPWKLTIGEHTWIGERAWLESLEPITIGSHVCISQGAYLCTGNHDWTDPSFSLCCKPIVIEDGAWVGACAVVLPGVTIADHSILAAGAVAASDTEAYMIHAGNLAVAVKERNVREKSEARSEKSETSSKSE